MGNFPKSLYLCTQKDKRMRKYILADNQEITRFALESLIRQKGENDILRATDKAGLVQLLKEHENAVVLLDYTLFDFADEEQLLIVAERFSLSEWILFSDELTPQFLRRVVYSSHQFSIIFKDGPLKDIRDALDAVNRHNRHISQRALEVIISQQQEDEEIINQIRSMKEEGEDVLDLVDAFKKLKEEKKGETDYETKLD